MKKYFKHTLALLFFIAPHNTFSSEYDYRHALVTLSAACQTQLVNEGVQELIEGKKPTKLVFGILGVIAISAYNRSQEDCTSLNEATIFGILVGNAIVVAPPLYHLGQIAYRMVMQEEE